MKLSVRGLGGQGGSVAAARSMPASHSPQAVTATKEMRIATIMTPTPELVVRHSLSSQFHTCCLSSHGRPESTATFGSGAAERRIWAVSGMPVAPRQQGQADV